jgi:hypothetical protein
MNKETSEFIRELFESLFEKIHDNKDNKFWDFEKFESNALKSYDGMIKFFNGSKYKIDKKMIPSADFEYEGYICLEFFGVCGQRADITFMDDRMHFIYLSDMETLSISNAKYEDIIKELGKMSKYL